MVKKILIYQYFFIDLSKSEFLKRVRYMGRFKPLRCYPIDCVTLNRFFCVDLEKKWTNEITQRSKQ